MKTIEEELRALGYGHRRHKDTEAHGTHVIYRLDTGQAIGVGGAEMALTLAEFDKAAQKVLGAHLSKKPCTQTPDLFTGLRRGKDTRDLFDL